jgi:hypothetical protein
MFIYYDDVNKSNSGRIMDKVELTASTKFTIGEAIKINSTNGVAVLWGAGGSGWGILTGFVDKDGSPVTNDGLGGKMSNAYTTPASGNTVLGVVDVSKTSRYSVTLDDTKGTTTGSDKKGVNFDLIADSDQLDESSVQGAGTTASFLSWGLDTSPNARANSVLVTIQESQVQI